MENNVICTQNDILRKFFCKYVLYFRIETKFILVLLYEISNKIAKEKLGINVYHRYHIYHISDVVIKLPPTDY